MALLWRRRKWAGQWWDWLFWDLVSNLFKCSSMVTMAAIKVCAHCMTWLDCYKDGGQFQRLLNQSVVQAFCTLQSNYDHQSIFNKFKGYVPDFEEANSVEFQQLMQCRIISVQLKWKIWTSHELQYSLLLDWNIVSRRNPWVESPVKLFQLVKMAAIEPRDF